MKVGETMRDSNDLVIIEVELVLKSTSIEWIGTLTISKVSDFESFFIYFRSDPLSIHSDIKDGKLPSKLYPNIGNTLGWSNFAQTRTSLAITWSASVGMSYQTGKY